MVQACTPNVSHSFHPNTPNPDPPPPQVVHTIAPTLLAAMRSVLDFALPDAATRERLWRALLPEGEPSVT